MGKLTAGLSLRLPLVTASHRSTMSRRRSNEPDGLCFSPCSQRFPNMGPSDRRFQRSQHPDPKIEDPAVNDQAPAFSATVMAAVETFPNDRPVTVLAGRCARRFLQDCEPVWCSSPERVKSLILLHVSTRWRGNFEPHWCSKQPFGIWKNQISQ